VEERGEGLGQPATSCVAKEIIRFLWKRGGREGGGMGREGGRRVEGGGREGRGEGMVSPLPIPLERKLTFLVSSGRPWHYVAEPAPFGPVSNEATGLGLIRQVNESGGGGGVV
jgi:hypothetical protein